MSTFGFFNLAIGIAFLSILVWRKLSWQTALFAVLIPSIPAFILYAFGYAWAALAAILIWPPLWFLFFADGDAVDNRILKIHGIRPVRMFRPKMRDPKEISARKRRRHGGRRKRK